MSTCQVLLSRAHQLPRRALPQLCCPSLSLASAISIILGGDTSRFKGPRVKVGADFRPASRVSCAARDSGSVRGRFGGQG